VFDNEVDPQWRADLWDVIRATPLLRWMLLTKRIGNVPKMIPADWPFAHVGIMATIVNQTEWNRDYSKLAAVPAPWRGVSMEPLLGPIDIGGARPDWIITGGESGPRHRPVDAEWVCSISDQCARNGIAFHHKQWGGVRPKQNGCELDGREWKQFPPSLEQAMELNHA
jgi:protein gp37